MHRYAHIAGPTHHLVDDEIVELPFRGHQFPYRLRIWRSHAGPAIVLASQVPGGAPPSWHRSRLANLAYRSYLCFPQAGMLYFEAESGPGEWLVQIEFDSAGHGLRRYLYQAIERTRRWHELKEIIRAEITP